MKKILSVITILCMVVLLMPCGTSISNAATNSRANSMVSYATKCVGKSKASLGLSGEWCASFVYLCAKKTGNSAFIGSNNYVGTQAKQTVNDKGGKITFVDKNAYNACKSRFKKSRCVYNPKYKPKKGDLYIQKGEDLGDRYFAHVGIVRKNSSSSSIVYTIEGNTSCSDKKHYDYNNVEYKTRNKKYFSYPYGFSAFVTPKYNTSYAITYSAAGATNVPETGYKVKGKTYYVSKIKPVRQGYSFAYWKGSNGKKYNAGSKYTSNKKLTLKAVWTTNTYTFSYDQKGYSTAKIKYGNTLTVSTLKPVRDGSQFMGWIVKRSDGKYYTSGTGWTTSSSSAAIYKPGGKYKIDGSWVKGTTGNKSYVFIAKWLNNGSVDTSNGKIVSAAEYNSTYKNNSNYVCTRVYRYATRTKQTTTSGYDTLSGYTKYDTKTTTAYSGYILGTPISTSTSYSGGSKITTSACNTGYYYYAYAAANPVNTKDWAFVCAKTRSGLIEYMKANYSSSAAWSENNLRYFWYVSSSDLGSTAPASSISKNIPYCIDSNVSIGTFNQSGTHYYDIPMYKYSRCYKVKSVKTTNYFYKWSAWSAWSDWVTSAPAASDTVKVDTAEMYLVKAK